MNNQIYALTKCAIDRADPIDLLKIGAPDDEYELEIREIVSRAGECMNLEDIQRLLHEVFTKWFDERIAGSKELYRVPAEAIWNKLHRIQLEKTSDESSA